MHTFNANIHFFVIERKEKMRNLLEVVEVLLYNNLLERVNKYSSD